MNAEEVIRWDDDENELSLSKYILSDGDTHYWLRVGVGCLQIRDLEALIAVLQEAKQEADNE